MPPKTILNSELILNPDGSIYHLNLRPEHLAETVITVGDPDRVGEVSKHFDEVSFKTGKREFVTHTGRIGNKRLTVLSTGIGTDNIDIVFNELDALVNIDLGTRQVKDTLTQLNIIRVGTSGGLHADLGVDSLLVSEGALGLDGLMNYYEGNYTGEAIATAFGEHLDGAGVLPPPYYAPGAQSLVNLFDDSFFRGITATCTGFYGPQGRELRLKPAVSDLVGKLQSFSFQGRRITNFEMETAGIYGMGQALGHNCCSVNTIVANRALGIFSKDPHKAVEQMIVKVLELVSR